MVKSPLMMSQRSSGTESSARAPAIGHETYRDSRRRLWWFTIGAVAASIVLTLLVQLHLLLGLDLTVTLALQHFANLPLDRLSELLSLVFSSEGTALMALIISFTLWRDGFGRWSLLPFAFAFPVAIELVLRLFIHQPLIPPQLYREGSYPLLNPDLPSSFPSGHAIRSSFVCTLGIALLAGRRDAASRTPCWLLATLFVVAALSRVYLGTHWLSDVVDGALLGTIAGLWTAQEIVHRYRSPS